MAEYSPLCSISHVCSIALLFPKEFPADPHIPVGNAGDLNGLETRVEYLVMFSFQSPSWHASRPLTSNDVPVSATLIGLYTL